MSLDLTLGSIEESELSGDRLQIIHISLDWAIKNKARMPWLKNAKLHDVGGIWESIKRYGFVDAAKWDSALNGGEGGIVYGNGRHECLLGILIEAKQKGEEPPRGIPTSKTGDWAIPITVGVDQDTEAMAIALGIDHNNLTLSGGNTSLTDLAAIWDQEGLVRILAHVAEQNTMPVTMDEDALASLLLGLDQASSPSEENDEPDLAEGEHYEGRVKPGEIWRLGDHFIACGDCCRKENIAELQRVAKAENIGMIGTAANCSIICDRWEKQTGKSAELAGQLPD